MQHSLRRACTRAAGATVALLLSAAWLSPVASAAGHDRTAPAADPGGIVAAEPSEFRLSLGVPTATEAWRIEYASTAADGSSNTVSGSVIVPKDLRKGPRPLVTYAVGTVGMGDQCAPSATNPTGGTVESLLINNALLRGWAVALTDYEGLGTPGDHTYTVGRAAGTAVLDAARAAQQLPAAQDRGVGADSPVGIMGYSQGGQASAWAAELHASYAPELDVKGVASGGVPAELTDVADHNDGGDNAGFVLMSAIGHDAAHPELGLDGYLNDKGRALIAETREGCTDEILDSAAGETIAENTTSNPLEEQDWQQRLAESTLGTQAPGFPAYVYHGGSDEIIPRHLGEGLRDDWCAEGNPVKWRSFAGQSHVGTAILGSLPAVQFLGERFEGGAVEDDCG
ncbi:lipase family protein [Streptomyces sulphureus]|uniref:lipase family protein n=1 Tax=Streptomyces sulphureus TaxID=47758 RepID=UPI00035E00C6|nr:lipase family protein [Streptomyces sulphureus]